MNYYNTPTPISFRAPTRAPTSPGHDRASHCEFTQRTVQVSTHVPFKTAKKELLFLFEREYLTLLLRRHGRNVSAASRAAGLSRKNLRELLYKHGMTPRAKPTWL